MSVFGNTVSGDLDRGPNGFFRVNGSQESLQHIRTRLRLLKKEVARDQRYGLDLFDFVMDPTVDLTAIANYIASYILDTPGVTDVDLTFDLDTATGDLIMEMDLQFEQDDLEERRPIHETLTIQGFGAST